MENSYLEEYYGSYDEEGRLLHKWGQVEYLTTCRYIDKYLKPGGKILEVGAGTGRYSLHYAAQGYEVDALELVSHNITCFRNKIQEGMRVTVTQGDARDLSCYEDDIYDMTLVLGPMYHLYTEEDKRKVIEEALRVTRPGGLVYFAFIMNDAVIVNWGLRGKNLVRGLQEGLVTKDFHCVSTPELLFEMITVEEAEALFRGFGIQKLHFAATDGLSSFFRDELADIDDALCEAWLQYHYKTCERPDLIGYSNHTLYIGKKE